MEKRPFMPLATAAPPVSTVTTADDGWYRAITAFAQRTPWLHGAMSFYTLAAIGLLALMAVYAWWRARSRADLAAMSAVVWLAAGTVLAVGCGLGIKQLVKESRPCIPIHVVTVQACPGPTDYSFPSDHTTVAVALAVGLWLVNRRLGAIGAVLAVIEGFSRVYLGQHYPHDVLAAIVLSTVVLLVGWMLLRRPIGRLVAMLVTTPLRPLLTSTPPRAEEPAPYTPTGNPADSRRH